jgi:hypothetical protein
MKIDLTVPYVKGLCACRITNDTALHTLHIYEASRSQCTGNEPDEQPQIVSCARHGVCTQSYVYGDNLRSGSTQATKSAR